MPPNILMITCDQLRKDALGCYGNPIVQTPHIDRIAAEGVRYDTHFHRIPGVRAQPGQPGDGALSHGARAAQ